MRSYVCDHGHDAVFPCCGGRHRTSRRQFLGGVVTSAVAASFPSVLAHAQTLTTAARRIDVHHHITPPAYIEALSPMKNLTPMTLSWTPERAIEEMDKGGVETSITSITTPGLWFGSRDRAQQLARACNDYAAKLNNQYPKRFGMFVNLPLPDIDGSLKEIEYGLDVLKADGVALFTSYGDKWLGDPAFDPVFAELDRRKAVVYTHPTTANCCTNLVPQIVDSTIEYGADTTRAIARMIFGGASARFPDIRLIWSHGGGVMPYLIGRFINDARKPEWRAKFPNGFMPEAQRFFYDTAQVSNKAALSALKAVIPTSKVLFGTDFPFLTAERTVKGITTSGVFDAAEMHAIDRDNALALMPQYRT